jgi:hypothetical protein
MNEQEGKYGLAGETSEVSQTSEVSAEEHPRPDYISYLLRLWRVDHGRDVHWRASLQRPGTEEPLWFADLEDLFEFLRAETGKVKSG